MCSRETSWREHRSLASFARNFQGYTTDPSDILTGLGASAIGRLAQGYAQNGAAVGRYAARIARGEFATAKGYALTEDDRMRAELIKRLMCDFRVDLVAVYRRHDRGIEALGTRCRDCKH
jgi:oxygen-independent coproporphyrinogen-3 oxidase